MPRPGNPDETDLGNLYPSTTPPNPGAGAGQGNTPCAPGYTKKLNPSTGAYECVSDVRAAGDMPCPSGQCKDVVSGQCRTPGHNEKVNETDVWERDTGGGRGYCKQRDGGGAGGAGAGGAGGAPGAGAGGGGGYGISSPGGTFNKLGGMFDTQAGTVWDELNKVLQGGTRYNPQVMAQLDSQAKLSSAGTTRGQIQGLEDSAVTRGVGRSSAVTSGEAMIRRSAAADESKAYNQNRIAKVNADFEDRMGALDRAQKWLDSSRDYVVRLDMTAADREKAIANIALGYARIAAERDMLNKQLANNLQVAQLQGMGNLWANTPF